VTVNKSNTVVVRPAPRPYTRPPHNYGGYHYYSHNPYHYRRYHGHYYGPNYHPWGFFVATVGVSAIVLSVNNQNYHYNHGVYYMQGTGGYTVVQAPIGAYITVLPIGFEVIVGNDVINNYYYGGTFYEKTPGGYTVITPEAGTLVANLPEGGKEETYGDITYTKYGDVYFQPTIVDGREMYEVVQVTKEE